MVALPGPVVEECIAYVTGEQRTPPEVRTFRGSLNWWWLSALTGILNGSSEDAKGLSSRLLGQLEGGSAERPDGIYGDEFGGGYAPLQHEVVLVLIRNERNGGRLSGALGKLALRWYGTSLRLAALLAVLHRDSVIVIGPGSRARSPVVDGLSLPLQLTLGALPRRFGVSGGAPDKAEYFWREDNGAGKMRRLMGVTPVALAAEAGVPFEELRAWVYRRDSAAGVRLASGVRSMNPLRVHGWANGDLLAYWPEYRVGGGPMGGASSINGKIESLLPRPVGPRNDTDSQHFASEDLVQKTWIEWGSLVGEFNTSLGPPDGSREPIKTQRQRIPIPAGRPVLSLLIDRNGARELPGLGASEPAPGALPVEPTPVPQPQPSPPPSGGENERVLAILAKFQQMRRGEVKANEMEDFIRRQIV